VNALIETLGLRDTTIVGHDIGGMVAYACLRAYPDLARVAILDVPIPGVDPWDEFVRSPFLWHFALHAVPGLSERLVGDRIAEYFDYFLRPARGRGRGLDRGGSIATYVDGLHRAGVSAVTPAVIEDAGHFPHQEQPAATWRALNDFIASTTPGAALDL
jgi:pimeloyl-ACP methyl ester carboxylesterase